jgi:hypothetical protein
MAKNGMGDEEWERVTIMMEVFPTNKKKIFE